MGRIHEAQRHPSKFDNTGKLPDTKKLAGIRSKEYQGEGFGQLRFDDTAGQISTQLQSSHGATQLNLGNLSHPKETDTSEGRGEGFELRTDQWGALRAKQGLLLSTYRQDSANGHHLDTSETKSQFESSLNNSKALSEVAKNQKTDEIESLEQLKEFAEQLEQKIAKFKKAVLLLNSPDGIALSTAEDIHFSADSQINQIAGDSINFSTQKNWIAQAQNKLSLFAAQGGIKAVAAQSKVEIQAQSDALDILAKKGIIISSTEDRIEISSPKEIVITGATSQITLNGSGIFPKTGGEFRVNATQHVFQSGASVKNQSPVLPKFNNKNWIALEHLDAENEPFANLGYKIYFEGNQIIEGKLDDLGKAHHDNVPQKAIKVEYEQRDYIDEPWGLYDLVLDQLNELKKEVNENND